MAGQTEKSRSLILLLAPPVTAALMWLAWSNDFAQELENVTIDWRFENRVGSDPDPHPAIALVGIDEHSLETYGKWQDWTRNIYGDFLQLIRLRPPKVIAFDLFFSENSKNAEEDQYFAEQMSFHPGTITGMYVKVSENGSPSESAAVQQPELHDTRPFPNVSGDKSQILGGESAAAPVPVIAESSWTGSVNFPPSEIDGIRREYPLIVAVGDEVYPSLALQTLMQWEGLDPEDIEIHLGKEIKVLRASGENYRIPIDRRGMLYLNYRDTSRFQVNGLAQIMGWIYRENQLAEEWPEERPPVTDQILVIGQSAQGLSDFGPTPYGSQEALFKVQATALDSILRSDYIKRIPKAHVILSWLAIAWLTLLLLRNARISLAILVPSAIIIVVILLALFVFGKYSLLIPLVLPVAGFALIHTTVIADRLTTEFREKRAIKGMFQSYVAPALVEQMIDSGQMPELGGEKKDITILFSDIQGFSAFSEELDPVELVELMVEYLSEMTDIVTDSGGTLDKYIGDAIDAMFGAPLPLENHTYTGVMASILMQRKQEELCRRWVEQNRSKRIQEMRTRIGINTGPAVVGNIGSKRRFNYTMMGDNVNLGARCESGAKTYGVYTMITGETHDAAKGTKDDIVYRYLDRIVVKGRSIPVRVYEVIETKDRVSDDTLECITQYRAALDKYFAQEWDSAREAFLSAAKLERFQPGRDHAITTNPSRMMAARCEIMKENPPGPEWDGVYEMTTK